MHRRQVGPAAGRPPRARPRGALDLADRPGQPAREPHRDAGRERAARDRRRGAGAASRVQHLRLDLVGRDDDEPPPCRPTRAGIGEEHRVPVAAAHLARPRAADPASSSDAVSPRGGEHSALPSASTAPCGLDEHRRGPRPQARAQVGTRTARAGARLAAADAREGRDRSAAAPTRASAGSSSAFSWSSPPHQHVGRRVRERRAPRPSTSSIATTSRVRSERVPRSSRRARAGSRRRARCRCARAVELLADLREVHVDRALVAEPVVAPHAVEDLLAARARARVLGQELQELELLAS